MPLLDRLSDTINKTGQDLKKKAKDVGDFSNLKMEKAQLLTTIEKTYLEIGRLAFTNQDATYQTQLAQIQQAKERIAAIDALCDERMGKVKCPGCGRYINPDDHFCPHCGHDLSLNR